MSIQGKAVKRAVLPAVLVVSAAWWAALTIYEAATLPRWFFGNAGVLFGHVWRTMMMVLYGVIAGASVSLFLTYIRRKGKEDTLAADAIRNMTTSMGAIPILSQAPAMSSALPDLSLMAASGDRVAADLKVLGKIAPAHARLMEAVLRVLNNEPNLPATHVPGGHGGNSLLVHSVWVADAMLNFAPSWTYEGRKNSKGHVSVKLRNPEYKFNPADPIIGIIALAHDLGKIECYIRDKSGKVVDTRKAHDLVSGQMIARMSEFWALPKEDRDAIISAISYYHHPQCLPLDPDGRVVDDRSIALMELLIKADKATGKREGDTTYANTYGADDDEDDEDGAPTVQVVDGEALFAAFVELIHEPERINGTNKAIRVGQKYGGQVYFSEEPVRKALTVKLGLSSVPRLGDGRWSLTAQLMEELSSRGLLVQEVDGKTYSHKRAMFKIAFFNVRNGKNLANWPAVFIMKPGAALPKIASMKDHLSRVEVVAPVWGISSATGKGGTESVPDLGGEADAGDPLAETGQSEEEGEEADAEGSSPAEAPVQPDASDDMIGDLLDFDPFATSEPAATTESAVSQPDPGAVDDFNSLAKKMGSDSPLKGLEARHLDKLGEKFQSATEAALADLEGDRSHRLSPRTLRAEMRQVTKLLEAGELQLLTTNKSVFLDLEELSAKRPTFNWKEAAQAAQSGEHALFAVVEASGKVLLRIPELQTTVV